MANYVAAKLAVAPLSHFHRIHPVLRVNYAGFEGTEIPLDMFFAAIAKDKKNTDRELSLILPDRAGVVRLMHHAADDAFVRACTE